MEKIIKSKTGAERNSPVAPAKTAAVNLIWGNDEYFVRARAQQLVDQLCPPAEQALGVELIDGACDTIDEAVKAINRCLEAVQTVGFLGTSKVVWLRSASFLSEGDPGRYELVKETLARLVAEIKAGLLPGQFLVISSPKVDRRSSFFKTCQAAGNVEELAVSEKSHEADQQAGKVLRSVLQDEHLDASDAVKNLILERTGTESRAIIQEITKLSVYLGTRRDVQPADVHAVVCSSREALGWDLADAVGTRNLQSALRVYRQLISQRESPIGMIVALENRFRDLIIFRECLDRRWITLSGSRPWYKVEWRNAPELNDELSKLSQDPRTMNPWRAGRLADQASNFSLDELIRCHRKAVEMHERMVSSPVPTVLLMEILLIKLLHRK